MKATESFQIKKCYRIMLHAYISQYIFIPLPKNHIHKYCIHQYITVQQYKRLYIWFPVFTSFFRVILLFGERCLPMPLYMTQFDILVP